MLFFFLDDFIAGGEEWIELHKGEKFRPPFRLEFSLALSFDIKIVDGEAQKS